MKSCRLGCIREEIFVAYFKILSRHLVRLRNNSNCLVSIGLTSLSGNIHVPYHIYKNVSLVCIQNKMTPVHIVTPFFLKFILISSSRLCLSLASSLFPSYIPARILCAFLISLRNNRNFVKNTKYGVPHYAVLFSLLSFSLFGVQIFSSVPYS
jgi:hypothetical protein